MKQIKPVQITHDEIETLETGTYRTIEAVCGKRQAVIMIAPDYISVICKNASHKAWRGAPKCHKDFSAALANYKSPEMKTIIKLAEAMRDF